VRLRPVEIPDPLLPDLEERVYGATYAPESATLNLTPERVFGTDLVAFVERWLLEAATGDSTPPEAAPAAGGRSSAP
jgi:hypothetical protein